MLAAEKYKFTKVNKNIEILIFISIFVSSIVFFKDPFEFYLHYVIFLGLIPFFFIRYGYPKYVIQILLLLLVVGVINVFMNGFAMFGFIKVWGGMFLGMTFYYYVLRYYKFNMMQIFSVYAKWSFYVCMIGLIQIISFRIGFQKGFDYSWILNKWGAIPGGLLGLRVNSIFSEPSTLAAVIAPAMYLSFYNLLHKENLFINKKQSLLIVFIYVLSSSSTGYLAILLTLFLVTDSLKLRYFFIGATAGILLFFIGYRYSEDFRYRVDTSEALWLRQDYDIENTNSSSFVLYNNWHVASTALWDSPIFGTGLGSYGVAYEKHSLTKSVLNYDFEFNTTDGNSLFIRMLVETGLVGVVFLLLIIFRCFIPKKTADKEFQFRIISHAILTMILVYFLRQGNYFLNAFPMFVMMYYYNWKQYKKSLEEKEIKDNKR